MADFDLTGRAVLEELVVSKKASDRIRRLRAELRGLQAEFTTLGDSLSSATTLADRRGILLSQREAVNRMTNLERRLGYTPEKMANILSLRDGVNKLLRETTSMQNAEIRSATAIEAKKKKQEDLYGWLVTAVKDLSDPSIDSTRPSVQRAKRYVTNAVGRLLVTPGAEEALGPEKMATLAEFYDREIIATKNQTKATYGLIGTIRGAMAMGSAGIAFGSMLSVRATSILGDRETGFTQIRDEVNKGIKYAGGAIGATLGLAIAGPIGAAILGAVGAVAGGWGERSKAAATVGKLDSIEMLRMRHLYGSSAGSFFMMRLMNQEGYATAEDFANLASASNVAPYAAAFGKVSEDQWTALSFMPNYFNALFSGGTPEQLMAAYKRDMRILGPGMGQLMTSMAGGLGLSENLRAFVNSDQYWNWMSEADRMRGYDQQLGWYAPGYERAMHNEAVQNRRTEAFSVERGTWTASRYNYDPYKTYGVSNTFGGAYRTAALPMFDMGTMGFVPRAFGLPGGTETNPYTQRELNIYIDNNKVNVGTVYTRDEDAGLYNYSSYTVGSNQ